MAFALVFASMLSSASSFVSVFGPSPLELVNSPAVSFSWNSGNVMTVEGLACVILNQFFLWLTKFDLEMGGEEKLQLE